MEKHLKKKKTNQYAFVVLNKQVRVKFKERKQKKLGKCKQITSTKKGNSYLAESKNINKQKIWKKETEPTLK